MHYSNEGTPLPGKPDNSVDYGRDKDRVFAPTSKNPEQVTVFEGKQSAADERVRKVRAEQYRSFHFRRFGKQPTEAEVNAFLDGPGAA